MKSRGWYLLVAAVGLVVWGSAGADEPEAGVAYTVRDVITIGSTERPPAIDGKGDDLTWGRGTKIPLVVPGSDGRAPANEVVAQVTRDDTALYVLFAVDDRKTERRGTKPTAAAPIWEQHSVELVLDLGADARSYHHFAVNEDNQQFAMAFLEGGGFANPVPQGSWASATGRSAQGWLAEIAIPASYRWVPDTVPAGSAYNVAQLYARLGQAIRTGQPMHPGFDDAVRQAARVQRRQAIEGMQAETNSEVRSATTSVNAAAAGAPDGHPPGERAGARDFLRDFYRLDTAATQLAALGDYFSGARAA